MTGTTGLDDHLETGVLPGGAKGTRTPDPLLAKQVLFQLSYSPRKPQVRRPSAQILVCSPAEVGDGVATRSAASVKHLLLGRCYRAQYASTSMPSHMANPTARTVSDRIHR